MKAIFKISSKYFFKKKWICTNLPDFYATAGPAPSRSGHHKNNKVVHIHGTNGAKFNGTNFFGTREPTCTYEEWHNPTSVYNATLKAEKNNGNGNGGGHRHRRSKSTSADRPKPGPDFHAVHLGK